MSEIEQGAASTGAIPEAHEEMRRPWLRPLVFALAGVVLLGTASGVATRFVHSEQPWSSVSCLDSTCTSGMPMAPSMPDMQPSRTAVPRLVRVGEPRK